MLALDRLFETYPDARFVWTHRDPAEVLGSVCSLISYIRSWVSDRVDADLGERQVELWSEALARAMAFRRATGEGRFADIAFGDLNADPVGTVERAYAQLGLDLSEEGRRRMSALATANPRGAHGVHEYALEEFGIDREEVRKRFASYIGRFDLGRGSMAN
jgi:hypothetical protein